MPLDFTNLIETVPDNLQFKTVFEPTKFTEKKYVINGNTGDYIGIVGKDFNCADHSDFFHGVQDTVLETLSPDEVANAKLTWKTARNNAWALMDMTLPNVTAEIVTDKHSTTVAQRIIALHGIDGSCSNQTYFGAIDFFCTNGMIRGEHDKVRRKNTSNFSLDLFIRDLKRSQQDFYAQTKQLQHWANTNISTFDVKAMLEKVMSSEKKATDMFSLYSAEAGVRGYNMFALYSAFTNYATYADERNGFNLRNTGNDTQAVSMFQREHEVSKWISNPAFKQLEAA